MVLSMIFLKDKHKILLHLLIFYEYQQFFQHHICFSIQPPDYSDPWPTLARSTIFFLNNVVYQELRNLLDLTLSNRVGVLLETGTGFFGGVRTMSLIFLFFCVVFFVLFVFVLCLVPNIALYPWIVHSWLAVWFCSTFMFKRFFYKKYI